MLNEMPAQASGGGASTCVLKSWWWTAVAFAAVLTWALCALYRRHSRRASGVQGLARLHRRPTGNSARRLPTPHSLEALLEQLAPQPRICLSAPVIPPTSPPCSPRRRPPLLRRHSTGRSPPPPPLLGAGQAPPHAGEGCTLQQARLRSRQAALQQRHRGARSPGQVPPQTQQLVPSEEVEEVEEEEEEEELLADGPSPFELFLLPGPNEGDGGHAPAETSGNARTSEPAGGGGGGGDGGWAGGGGGPAPGRKYSKSAGCGSGLASQEVGQSAGELDLALDEESALSDADPHPPRRSSTPPGELSGARHRLSATTLPYLDGESAAAPAVAGTVALLADDNGNFPETMQEVVRRVTRYQPPGDDRSLVILQDG